METQVKVRKVFVLLPGSHIKDLLMLNLRLYPQVSPHKNFYGYLIKLMRYLYYIDESESSYWYKTSKDLDCFIFFIYIVYISEKR